MIWSERWALQNLLRTESGGIKVGFVVQKLHGPEILKMQNFALGARFRALSYISPVLPGGRSLRARVLLWQDVACGDDSFIVSRIVQALFFPTGGRSRILVEEKKLSIVRRFGP